MHRTSLDWVSQDSNNGWGRGLWNHSWPYIWETTGYCLLGERVNSCQRCCLLDALVNIPIPRFIQEALRVLSGFKKWVVDVDREKWWGGGGARVWTEVYGLGNCFYPRTYMYEILKHWLKV